MQVVDDRQRNRLLTVLFVGVLMGALDIAIVGPALPAIQASFNLSHRAVAWIFNIYVLFGLVGTPVMAKLADLYGPRRIYILDVALFALGSLVVALSPSFTVMLVGRAVQAFGAGGIFPVASAVIGDTFPKEKRGSALGLIGAVFGVAFLLGPILGGILLNFSWHWLFYINLPVAAWLIWRSSHLLPAGGADKTQAFDWAGVGVASVLLASLAFGVTHIEADNFGSSLTHWQVWPFILLALVLLPIFWQIEQRAADPLLRPGLLQKRQVKLIGAFAIGAGLAETVLVFLPSLAVSALGVSDSSASFLLLPVVVLVGVGAPLVGKMLDRVRAKPVITTGLALTTLGLILFQFTGHSTWLFILAGAVVGLGLSSLLGAPLRYVMLEEADANERASAQGALRVFTGTGQLLGGAIVGAVAASGATAALGYREALLVVGIITGILILFAFGLKGRESAAASQSQPKHSS